MASTFTCSGFSRRVFAGLVLLAAVPAPLAAASWDLPPPRVSAGALSFGSDSALFRTLSAQGVAPTKAAASLPGTQLASLDSTSARSLLRSALPESRAATAAPSDRPMQARSSGGPDVFGSTAISIGRTPYDGMWRRASGVSASAVAGWTGSFTPLRGGNSETLLREVNAWVNRRIDFVEDNVDGVPAEIWQSAGESLRRGRGDCEDYALAKLALLAALGFDRDDLYLVVARDLITRGHHAVLAVRTGDRFVILDNATDELVEGERANDYRPIFSYSSAGRWIHGFAPAPAPEFTPAPIQIASAVSAVAAP